MSFQSHISHKMAVIPICLAVSQTPSKRLQCKAMHMGLVHCVVCLFTPQLSLIITVPG